MTTDITLRRNKSQPLTFDEVDDNFENLKATADAAEGNLSLIQADVDALEAANTVIDGRLDGHDTDITNLQNADVIQDGRLDALEESATVEVTEIVASANQTVFTVAEYTPGTSAIVVFLNGVALSPSDYSEASSTTIQLNVGATAGDVFVARSISTRALGFISSSNVQHTPSGGSAISVGEYLDQLDAGQVEFTQAGTGAVARTSQDKMREVVSVKDFGAVADTTELVNGTDNATAFQNALAVGLPIYVPAPPDGFAYGISQITLPRACVILGPGMYKLAIRGISTSATITAGTSSGELKREVTITDLFVENNRGGDAVDVGFCPDFNFTRVYFRSVGNATLGTSAARGLNAKNCERGQFTGHCRFGGNPALRLVKDCNAVRGDNVTVSGGALGLAVDISGCQTVRLKLTIETSLKGIRIGDNTGDNAANGGWCSGIDLSGSYLESVGTPIEAGHAFAVSGLNLNDCWLNNGALSDSNPFPVSSEILRIGRVKSLSLKGGRWVGAGTEAALSLLEFVATSGAAPGALETSDIDLTVFENVGTIFDNSLMVAAATKATAAATNKVRVNDFGLGWGVPYEWISPTLTANVTYETRVLTGAFPSGGRVTSVEVIEGNGGSLNGARIRVGNSVSLTESLDKTFAAISPAYEDQGVTNGFIRPNSDLRFRLDAGTGAGTFRVRIRAIVGTA